MDFMMVFILGLSYTLELTLGQVYLLLINTMPNTASNASRSEYLRKVSFFRFGHFDPSKDRALLRIAAV
jgi:hypothetical protein